MVMVPAPNPVLTYPGPGQALQNTGNASVTGGLLVTGVLDTTGAARVGDYLDTTAIVTPGAPTAGLRMYPKADNHLYVLDAASVETDLMAATATVVWPLLAPNGVVGAPSYSFAASVDTGMFSAVVDTLSFAANGAEIVRVDGTGLNLVAGDLTLPAVTTPAPNPAVSTVRVYPKADNHLYVQDSTGLETDLMGPGTPLPIITIPGTTVPPVVATPPPGSYSIYVDDSTGQIMIVDDAGNARPVIGADNALRTYVQTMTGTIDPGGSPAPVA